MAKTLLRRAIQVGRNEGARVLFRKSIRKVKSDIGRFASSWFPVEKKVDHPSIEFNILAMRTPPDYGLGKDYPTNQCHEPIVTQAVIDSLSNISKPTFWDVGAASGYYSVLATQIMEDGGNIHAFEAGRTNMLDKNNLKYADGEITINNDIVGDDPSTTLTLDNYYKEHGCPDVVKIDVDGAEKEILSGMKQVVRDCTPIILLEIHFFNQDYDRFTEFITEYFNSRYNFKICTSHRDINAEWTDMSSIDNLPEENSKEDFPDPDYMLFCYPEDRPI